MKYLQLSKKIDEGIIKDWVNSRFWELIKWYLEEHREQLKSGIISWLSEDMSKTIYSKRDLRIHELELIDEFLDTPDRLLTRISNQTDISVEDDH